MVWIASFGGFILALRAPFISSISARILFHILRVLNLWRCRISSLYNSAGSSSVPVISLWIRIQFTWTSFMLIILLVSSVIKTSGSLVSASILSLNSTNYVSSLTLVLRFGLWVVIRNLLAAAINLFNSWLASTNIWVWCSSNIISNIYLWIASSLYLIISTRILTDLIRDWNLSIV